MKRFVLTGCVFLLAVPLFLTSCGQSPEPTTCRYVYDHITDQGQKLDVTYSHGSYFVNGGQETLTAATSTTVTVSADAGVEADLGAIVTGVKAQLHVSVSYSVTTSITESATVTVPDGNTLSGEYGAYEQLASGHLYSPNCGRDYGSHVSSYIPMHTGWCTWLTPGKSPTPPPCESSSPTSTPTSYLRGQLALMDPLNGPTQSNWHMGDGCSFANGGYQVDATSSTFHSITCSAENTSFSNFSYEVQVKITYGRCGGISFRWNARNDTGYHLYICTDGQYYLTFDDNNSPSTLTSGSTDKIRGGIGQLNLIAVTAQGKVFSLYVNKQFITSTTGSGNNPSSKGQIGVFATSTDAAIFSNARVWML